MANVVTCPSCNRSLRVPDDLVGTRVQCPSCKETFTANVSSGATERPSSRRPRRDEDEIDDEQPSRSRNLAPHRGDTIQLLGILSFFLVPHILGPIAWVMGRGDLREMDEGRMDPAGRQATQTGKTCGMIAAIIWYSISLVAFLIWLTIVVIYGACCCAMAGAGGAGGPPPRRY